MKINKEFEKLIPPLKDEEYNQLKNNIQIEGYRDDEPILLWNGFIIDGHNRNRACNELNVKPITKDITKQFETDEQVKVWMINNQLGRRNLPDFWRGELTATKRELLMEKGKENMSLGSKEGLSQSDKPSVDTRKQIAKDLGWSTGKVGQFDVVRKNADNETKEKLRNEEITIRQAYEKIKAEKKKEAVLEEAEEEKEIPLPDKKYNIIYADPPWKYFESGNKNQSNHYKTMTIDEIKELPIENLTKDDCLLFIWITFPILPDALEVIKSWGFEYSTCGFNWVKRTVNGKWFFGNGAWTRANSELCLIAKKGKPIRFDASVSQIIESEIEGHSKKPDEVRDKIVKLAGNLPRIELFARDKAEGWDRWGNEVQNDN